MIAFSTDFELSRYTMLLSMLIILGMFMDQLSIMMLTLPIFMSLVATYGFDPVWLGILILLALQLRLATPPFGLLLFVMFGVAPPGTTMREVVFALAPSVLCTVVLFGLLALVPDMAFWLPAVTR